MSSRLCAVSVDLDSISCYEQIHGLPASGGVEVDPVYVEGVPRLLSLFDELGVKATFFVIGREAERPAHAEILREAVARGHELANHSYSHPYRLIQLQKHEIATEISQGAAAIEALLPEGQRVVGFRCPGYNISRRVIRALRAQGYRYDSSVFPCPPYLLARATIIGLMSLRGRHSRSLPGPLRALWAPTSPYHPDDDPYRPGAKDDLWELPMSVVPWLRLHYIGTSIMLYPKWTLPWLTRMIAASQTLFNFELHGIDVLDGNSLAVAHLRDVQPDLRVSLDEKLDRLKGCLRQINRTHSFATLRDAVEVLEEES